MSVLALLNSDGEGFTVFVDAERAKFYDGKDLEHPRVPHKSGYILRLNPEEAAVYVNFLMRECRRCEAETSRFNPGLLGYRMQDLWRGAQAAQMPEHLKGDE